MGIGRGIAVSMADAGCKVILASRSEATLNELATELNEKRAGSAEVLVLDLSETDQIAEKVSHLGPVDILVNCGGLYDSGTMSTATCDLLEKSMRCNVLGPYELTRCLLPGVIQNQGHVVFINSSVINNVGPHTGRFAATAQALRAIADSLRAEINPLGVRVLSVFPGRTATPRQKQIFAKEERAYTPEQLLQPEDIAKVIINHVCLPATAEVTEVWIRPAHNFKT